MKEKLLRCFARTAAGLVTIVLLALVLKYLDWSYEDTKIVLILLYEYFPMLVILGVYGSFALLFFRATKADNNFDFMNFFKKDSQEDMKKFSTFVLLGMVVGGFFFLLWKDKDILQYVGIVLSIFVIGDLGSKFLEKKGPQ